jgi:NADP-dependent 3-hydroxy acid dehydrogenase YdfG
MAMPPQAVAETIAFAIAQPDSVDIGEVIVRPTSSPSASRLSPGFRQP